MKTPSTTIPVFFSIDDRYAPYLCASLSSLIQNASREYEYHIIVLYKKLSKQHMKKLSALATDGFDIEFVAMGNRLSTITNRKANLLRADYFTLTIYFRLFIPVMFPEYQKAVYLDSDTIILGDIAKLYQIDLGDNYLGAAADNSILEVPQLAKYIEYGIGVDKHSYINSGVLLMNLKRLREVQFEERFLDLLSTYHFDCLAPDQDYLNVLCQNRITYLPASWNTMPGDRNPPAKPDIIHYNLFAKPWHYDNVQYQEYFWQYAEKSVYLTQIMNTRELYSEDDRRADQKHMDLLLTKGESIADAKVNFRTVFQERKELYL